jgi:hypothetical protein
MPASRAHDGLGPVGDVQLIEDAIDVIANGFSCRIGDRLEITKIGLE